LALTSDERNNPLWDLENHIARTTFFHTQHNDWSTAYDGDDPLPENNNSADNDDGGTHLGGPSRMSSTTSRIGTTLR
jgi:hypothetical protein